MTVYLAFNEHIDQPSLGTNSNLFVVTTGIRSHVRAGFYAGNSASFTVPIGASLTQGWATVYANSPTSGVTGISSSANAFGLVAQNGTVICSLRAQSQTDNVNFYNNYNGTTTFLWTNGARKVDINFRIAVDGFLYVYMNNVLVYSFTGDTTSAGAITSVQNLRFVGVSGTTTNTSAMWFSEVLVSDQPTINSKVITRAFTAFGDVNQFTGAITDINAASDSDTTSLSEVTAGEITTFASAAIPALGVNDQITAVGINFRANAEPSSPVTRLAPLVRKAGTNYIGSAQLLGTSIANYSRFWETDPATGAVWTEADVNAIQLGFQAQA